MALRMLSFALAMLCAGARAVEYMAIAGEPNFPIVYVVYSPGGLPLARAVVRAGEPCPALKARSNATAHLVQNTEVLLRAEGTAAMPFAFPVRVCETQLPRDLPGNSTTFGGRLLPAITWSPTDYVLIGDTGMRVKPKNLGTCGKFGKERLYHIQQCTETVPFDPKLVKGSYQAIAEWPLESIMDNAANAKPDVVIHVGDYLYREGPCAEGKGCEAMNNASNVSMPGEWGDNWNGWYADFFEPSAALLEAAPWVVARGNHESCHRGGHGWFMFLDPRPLPTNWTADYCVERTDAYPVSFKDEQFLVVDDNFVADIDIDDYLQCPEVSGSAQGKAVPLSRYEDPEQDKDRAGIQEEIDYFAEQFRSMGEMSESHRTNFYLGHHPLLGVACYKGKYAAVDWTLQESLKKNPAVLDRVSAAITGHVHFFQGLVFESNSLPMSLVVGNGGTMLDAIQPAFTSAVDGLEVFEGAKVQTSYSVGGVFGFSTMRRSHGGFDLRAIQAGNNGVEASSLWAATIPKERAVRRLQAAGAAAPATFV